MLFSILMCTRNSSDTLERALNSVRNQKYCQWELICLDNGSSDASLEILMEYEKMDSRISCIYRQENVGWCKGISICLQQASGQYMMFLGADDCLANEFTLEEVFAETQKHHPDIIWTGCAFAILKNGRYHIESKVLPSYKVYEKESKLVQLTEIIQSVYRNSVMHYVSIEFLKKNGIDFFDPFYGDSAGMTEALCKAGKMVVMDKVEYILTRNTSQTALTAGFDQNIGLQWFSIKKILPDLKKCPQDVLQYIADNILKNPAAICVNIMMGANLRNKFMNPVEKNMSQRFMKAEEWISSEAFGEMMYYAGRLKFEESLLGAAGVLYWTCKKYDKYIKQILSKSKWLADFSEAALYTDESGNISWRTQIGKREGEKLLKTIKNNANPHCIGCELLLKECVVYEDLSVRKEIQHILHSYLETMI